MLKWQIIFQPDFIHANGLEGMQKYPRECALEVEIRLSGCNGKAILETKQEAAFNCLVESGDAGKMFISEWIL